MKKNNVTCEISDDLMYATIGNFPFSMKSPNGKNILGLCLRSYTLESLTGANGIACENQEEFEQGADERYYLFLKPSMTFKVGWELIWYGLIIKIQNLFWKPNK